MSKTNRIILYFISQILRLILPTKKNRVFCWSYNFTKYSCNPRYISEFLLTNSPEHEIIWCFKEGLIPKDINNKVKIVRWGTIYHLFYLYTSKFVISNSRNNKYVSFFRKKHDQLYVMTWHSSMSIKKVEGDALDDLTTDYIKRAKEDSQMCDLIFSGCKFRSSIIRRAFFYDGFIMEHGTPRNDVLFNIKPNLKLKVCRELHIDNNKSIVLYAPTFRKGLTINHFLQDWTKVKQSLKLKFNRDFEIVVRLHPHYLSDKAKDKYNYTGVVNGTLYNDMQELLAVSDILVTDYSSSIFDMSLLCKPCFIYADDIDCYNRGLYFNYNELPFSIAKNINQLVSNIENYDSKQYKSSINNFNRSVIGSFEEGKACYHFLSWMKKNK